MVTTALIPAPELLFVTMPLRLNVGGGVGVGLGLGEELDPPQPAREKATKSAVKVRRIMRYSSTVKRAARVPPQPPRGHLSV